LIGLRVLDAQEGRGRRFGDDADALWDNFKGHLHLGNRIELLLRDAAVTWGAAFSPARAYRLPSVAQDEPFGPDWPGLEGNLGRRLWNEALEVHPSDPAAEFDRMMTALDVRAAGAPTIGEVSSATRILASGLSALGALVREFRGRPNLEWSEQVVVVSDEAAERQLAGLAAVLFEASRATRLIDPLPGEQGPADAAQALREAGFSAVDRVALSTDARPAGRRFAELVAPGIRGGESR